MAHLEIGQQVVMLDKNYRYYYESGDNTGVIVDVHKGWFKVKPNRTDIDNDAVISFRLSHLRMIRNSGGHLPFGVV